MSISYANRAEARAAANDLRAIAGSAGWKVYDTTTPHGITLDMLCDDDDSNHTIRVVFTEHIATDQWGRLVELAWWTWDGSPAPTAETFEVPASVPLCQLLGPLSVSAVEQLVGQRIDCAAYWPDSPKPVNA